MLDLAAATDAAANKARGLRVDCQSNVENRANTHRQIMRVDIDLMLLPVVQSAPSARNLQISLLRSIEQKAPATWKTRNTD